jgi:hypothetical protein
MTDDEYRDTLVRLLMHETERFFRDPEYRARVEADPNLHENGRQHMQRVENLIKAWNLLNGEPLPTGKPLNAVLVAGNLN